MHSIVKNKNNKKLNQEQLYYYVQSKGIKTGKSKEKQNLRHIVSAFITEEQFQTFVSL